MASEIADSTSTYDSPLRHSRTLSRISQSSQASGDLLPVYPHPIPTQTSSETLRPAKETSDEVKKELAEGGLGVDGFVAEECASAIKSSFTCLPKALRTLDLRTPYLRGGGGRGFVTTAETADNKQRVADAARVMKECVVLIDAGVARGARVEAAERKATSGATRSISNPFQEVKEAYLEDVGTEGMAFLDRIDTSVKPATSYASWLNPLAYSLPSYSFSGSSDDKQDDQDVPLLKADEEEGNYGEKLTKQVRPYSKLRLAMILTGLAVVVTATSVGLVMWMKHGDHPTATLD